MKLWNRIMNKVAGPLSHEEVSNKARETCEKILKNDDMGVRAKLCARALSDIYERGRNEDDRKLASLTLQLMKCCGSSIGSGYAPFEEMRSFPKSQVGLEGLKTLGRGAKPEATTIAAMAASIVAGCPPWAAIEVGEAVIQMLTNGSDESIKDVAAMAMKFAERTHIDYSEPAGGLSLRGRAAISGSALEFVGKGMVALVAGSVTPGAHGAILAAAVLSIAERSDSASSLNLLPGLSVGGQGTSIVRMGLSHITNYGRGNDSRNIAYYGLDVSRNLLFSDGRLEKIALEAIKENVPFNEETMITISSKMMKATETNIDMEAIASATLEKLEKVSSDDKVRTIAANGLAALEKKSPEGLRSALTSLKEIEIYLKSKKEVDELITGLKTDESHKSAIIVENEREFIDIGGVRLEIKKR